MSVFNHPLVFAAIYVLCFLPLFFFHFLPFRNRFQKQDLRQVLFANLMVILLLFGSSAWYTAYIPSAHWQLLFKCNLLGYFLLSFITPLLVLRRRVREMLFVAGVVGIFALMGFSISLFVAQYLPLTGLLSLEAICGMMLIYAVLVYPFIKSTLTQTVTPLLDTPDSDYWKNIWIIPLAMLAAAILPIPFTTFLNTPSQLISRLLISLATLFMCRSIAYDFVLLSHRVQLETQLDAQREYYKALAEKLHSDRRARHDFQHHLSALCALADREKTADLKAYCRRLLADAGDAMPLYTGNGAVDGVIHRYSQQCKEACVRLDFCGHLPEHSALEPDLCIALGNALENALTATTTLPPDKRFIEVVLISENTLLTITVKNSFDGIIWKENDTILSRKRSHEAGLGLESIRTVCETHGGTISIRYDENTFAIMMLMDLS